MQNVQLNLRFYNYDLVVIKYSIYKKIMFKSKFSPMGLMNKLFRTCNIVII